MTRTGTGWRYSPAFRVGMAAGLVIAVCFLGWLLLIRDDESQTVRAGGGPVAAAPADLAKLGRKLGSPVYWAGAQDDTELELTRTDDDRVFVRYLDEGVEIGDPQPSFLTVGTYPLEDAFKLLQQAGEREGAIVEDGPEGSVVITHEDSPTSVYVGFPGEDYQVEIYDPDPDHALDLATSGQIEPAG